MTTAIPPARRIGAMTALALGVLSYGLMQTMLVPAIGVLQQAMHTGATGAAWAVLSAPLLASAILTPLVGRLGDHYGRRRMLLVVLTLYLGATLVALAAPNIGVLIAARAGQGISLAVLPLAFGSVPNVLPHDRVHAGLGLLSGLVGGAAGIALVCGGLIVDHASWRWLFVAGAGLIAVTLVLTYVFVPEGPARATGGFDPAGTVLLAGGLSGILLALTLGPGSGWFSVPVLATAAAGVAMLAGFLGIERRLRYPLIDMDLVLHPRVGTAHLAIFVLGTIQFLYYVLVPKLAELPSAAGGFGASVTTAGLVMLPATVVILPAGTLAGRLTTRHGPQLPLISGLLVTASGAALLALAHDHLWQLAVCALPIGIGTGLVMTAAPAQLHRTVDTAHAATANGINTVARTVGGALGSQLAAALIVASVPTGFPTAFWTATVIGIVGAAVTFAGSRPQSKAASDPTPTSTAKAPALSE
ncbi:MFS transporter [Nocardia transvalensis]|uniref:MFS transporter n=1 Tax=Nocardia transvalensis TaxID=37333 RepID=UPI001894036C|nr:MFS transporter [Nocardia transvalensis]MBF6328612.1 MFS transporter [Nocardia transvalensis]